MESFNLLDNIEKSTDTPQPITIDKMDGGEIDLLEHMEDVTHTLTKDLEDSMKGGAKTIDLTDHFSKFDEEQYEKTLEYINNYKSKEYSDYLKEYDSFLIEKNIFSNLKKYKYFKKNDYFVKVSIKDKTKNILVYKPRYARINNILKQIKLNI